MKILVISQDHDNVRFSVSIVRNWVLSEAIDRGSQDPDKT
jgi:hypothetical protein